MNSNFRIIALFLAAAMLTACFASCNFFGGRKNPPDEVPSDGLEDSGDNAGSDNAGGDNVGGDNTDGDEAGGESGEEKTDGDSIGETDDPTDPGGSAELDPEPEQKPEPEPEPFRFTSENMPRIDGSTATIPLIEAVRSVLLGAPREEAFVSGTDDAYENLLYKNADLLLVYSPSPRTLEDAADRNALEMAPIGKDALVFLVNAMNSVTDLTAEQLVDIYSGKVTNWKDVGGADSEIIAYQRQLLSGSQTMMDRLVMKDVPMAEAPEHYIIGAMGALVDAVAAYDNSGGAIGYNVYYYMSRMKLDDNIKLLSVGGVEPSNENISSGAYPFVSDFYVVIRADSEARSPERILFDWIQTPDGQALVANEGYVPYTAN